jgi:hypothetical protein
MRKVRVRRLGVILFSLALGIGLVRPAPAAAYSWDLICSGNQLNLCSSVNLVVSGSTVTMTLTNLSDGPLLTDAGLAGSGFVGFPISVPPGWAASRSRNFSTFYLGASSNNPGGGIGKAGQLVLRFSFMGTFSPATLVLHVNGKTHPSWDGNEDPGVGHDTGGGAVYSDSRPPGDPSPSQLPGTAVPEPATMLLLVTGLAAVVAMRIRRREEEE